MSEPSNDQAGMLRWNYADNIIVDIMVPCIARSSATMTLIIYDTRDLVYLYDGFLQPAASQYHEMIKRANIYLYLKKSAGKMFIWLTIPFSYYANFQYERNGVTIVSLNHRANLGIYTIYVMSILWNSVFALLLCFPHDYVMSSWSIHVVYVPVFLGLLL